MFPPLKLFKSMIKQAEVSQSFSLHLFPVVRRNFSPSSLDPSLALFNIHTVKFNYCERTLAKTPLERVIISSGGRERNAENEEDSESKEASRLESRYSNPSRLLSSFNPCLVSYPRD